MKDEHKTQIELIEELQATRRKISDLERTNKNRGAVAESFKSERDTAEEALRQSERRYRALVEIMNDGFAVQDPAGLVSYVNHRLCEMLGYGADEIVGRPWRDMVDAAGLEVLKEQMDKQNVGETSVYEIPLKTKDGRTVLGLIAGSPIFDADGNLTGSIGVITDMTDRERMEQKIKQSEGHLRAIFDATIDGLLVCDMAGTVVEANPSASEMSGYTHDELVGMRWSRLVHPNFHGRFGTLMDAIEAGEDFEATIDVINKDGSSAIVEARGKRIVYSGKPHMYLALQDITERKRAELDNLRLNEELEEKVTARTAELEASNKELEAFAYSISHDLRAPLRSMDGFSKELAENHRDALDAQGRDCLDRIRQSVERLGTLIDGLLNLSVVTRKAMARSQVDLTGLARKISDELRETHSHRDVEIVIAPGLEVNGDETLLRAMLYNLLDNAWKFTGRQEHARIEVGLTENEEGSAFFVRDNGVGFDMKFADQLFKPFKRLHSITEFGGTGIGLATVKRILNRHGGRAWAEAREGDGATFYFTL